MEEKENLIILKLFFSLQMCLSCPLCVAMMRASLEMFSLSRSLDTAEELFMVL